MTELPGLPLLCQGMFEPYLKSFYIRSTDPTQIKILKVSDGESGTAFLPRCPYPQTRSGTHRGRLVACLFLGLSPGPPQQKCLLRKPG